MPFIENQGWKLFYKKYDGKTDAPLLLFHGFGQTHTVFDELIDSLQDRYTCYSFDLFHHGRSVSPEDGTLEVEGWNRLFTLFRAEESIEKFSLGGFSLGGKYVLACYMAYPQNVDNVYFIAPDGLKTNIWYSLATYPRPLRNLFKSMIRHPQRFYVLIRVLKKLKLIQKSVLKFVEHQMKTPDQRLKVYNTWVGIRRIKYKSEDISQTILDHSTHTQIFLGKHDKIIPKKPFKNFCNQLPSCSLQIMDCGHNDLISSVANYYSER